ncbi:MAG: hypothetical protein JJE04_24780 [Acidobacteriia bacterium]|nr:hypothetical protein [Terriglobia bacterium]
MGIDPLLAENARANLRQILGENRSALLALKREPAIARLEVKWLDTEEVEYLYVCRASSASVRAYELDGRLVSYRAPLGRLAEIPAGEEETIALPIGRREALVRCRLLIHPRLEDSGWDAVDNAFELFDHVIGVDSIRRLIEHARRAAVPIVDYLAEILAEDEAKQLFFDQRRRKTVDRMALRDQPILDQFQGSVFRLPLDRQVLLLGPPGAGKTTTLIRRLAQKRTEEALTAEENERLTELGLKDGVHERFRMGHVFAHRTSKAVRPRRVQPRRRAGDGREPAHVERGADRPWKRRPAVPQGRIRRALYTGRAR